MGYNSPPKGKRPDPPPPPPRKGSGQLKRSYPLLLEKIMVQTVEDRITRIRAELTSTEHPPKEGSGLMPALSDSKPSQDCHCLYCGYEGKINLTECENNRCQNCGAMVQIGPGKKQKGLDRTKPTPPKGRKIRE